MKRYDQDLNQLKLERASPFAHLHIRKGKPEDNSFVERSHRIDDEEFYRLEKRGFKDLSLRDPVGKDFMLKASEWIWYYKYDRSHDGLGGKSPAEAVREVNPKLPRDILFLPPIILDDRITLLGVGTEVYRCYTLCTRSNMGMVCPRSPFPCLLTHSAASSPLRLVLPLVILQAPLYYTSIISSHTCIYSGYPPI